MVFIDTTGSIGIVVKAITDNITGSIFLTMLFITIVLIAFFYLWRIPTDVVLILMVPFIIVIMAFTKEYVALGGLALIYMGIIFFRRFWLNG